jgi:pyridoxal phosphate enzyme (YggS family)
MKHQQFDYLAKLAKEKDITLVAVSKTQPLEKIMELYDRGQRVFGENRVQELVDKQESLPKDIEWHLIGHLQTNKVKYITPFVGLIHSVDSLKLLAEIDKQANKVGRVIPILLQVYIADEETKFGFLPEELLECFDKKVFEAYKNISIKGLMGMATNTENGEQVRKEFNSLNTLYKKLKNNHNQSNTDFNILSMGMSGDYELAIQEGSNMIRVGSLIFGERS